MSKDLSKCAVIGCELPAVRCALHIAKQLKAERNAALEEAAKVAEAEDHGDLGGRVAERIATAVHALRAKSDPSGETLDIYMAFIREERAKQDAKWGEQNHTDDHWMMILQEELGEAAQALLNGKGDDAHGELIQSAAVLVAWLECRHRAATIRALKGLDKEGR